jgi:hypothetical protein
MLGTKYLKVGPNINRTVLVLEPDRVKDQPVDGKDLREFIVWYNDIMKKDKECFKVNMPLTLLT